MKAVVTKSQVRAFWKFGINKYQSRKKKKNVLQEIQLSFYFDPEKLGLQVALENTFLDPYSNILGAGGRVRAIFHQYIRLGEKNEFWPVSRILFP